jgi:hypothetical protein
MLDATQQTHRAIAEGTARPGVLLAVMTGGILSDEDEASHAVVILPMISSLIAAHHHVDNTLFRRGAAPGKALPDGRKSLTPQMARLFLTNGEVRA